LPPGQDQCHIGVLVRIRASDPPRPGEWLAIAVLDRDILLAPHA
jgi:hypothetical protein